MLDLQRAPQWRAALPLVGSRWQSLSLAPCTEPWRRLQPEKRAEDSRGAHSPGPPPSEEDGRDQSKLETKVWEAHNPLTDKQIDQFLVVAR
ncbi:hypothetical protein P7K49_018780 [Saguinus oedipus]|uniref:ELM2 domain-containing protein n=1 Tax=Saguinus oedipus TaxID=9490 RepID=A0ABQ9V6C7_SAGOE|nr:hypothetical protein P7K49_018780 [Saguinus oedipus]